jgi:hypothetical protein
MAQAKSFKDETRPILRRRHQMKPINTKKTLELDIQIEELEQKVAPDGGETVLPLPTGIRHR